MRIVEMTAATLVLGVALVWCGSTLPQDQCESNEFYCAAGESEAAYVPFYGHTDLTDNCIPDWMMCEGNSRQPDCKDGADEDQRCCDDKTSCYQTGDDSDDDDSGDDDGNDEEGNALAGYGIGAANDSSCGNINLAGYRVDRMYGSKCFGRMVYCEADNSVVNVTVCGNDNEIYLDDTSTSCVASDSDDARTNCGVTVHCGESEISVHVTDDAIWQQTDAPLQFGTGSDASCKIAHGSGAYDGTLSLLTAGSPKWDNCGATREVVTIDDQLAVKYSLKVMRSLDRDGSKRVQETHGATVTREKCFMMDAYCYYKADGTASSSYHPTAADALHKEDEHTIDFDMYPINCVDGSKTTIQSVYATEKVCFETEIVDNWHKDIRVSTTKCWATPNADDSLKYELLQDETFAWDCHNGMYKEKFHFDAFRFQNYTNSAAAQDWNSELTYAQSVHIHCQVNACDDGDTDSTDCNLHTKEDGNPCSDPNVGGARRRRRAAVGGGNDMSVISKFTKGQTMSKVYVIQPDMGGGAAAVTYNSRPKYSLLSDTLSMAMFATGCIFAVVAAGLLMVLKRAKHQLRYRILTVE